MRRDPRGRAGLGGRERRGCAIRLTAALRGAVFAVGRGAQEKLARLIPSNTACRVRLSWWPRPPLLSARQQAGLFHRSGQRTTLQRELADLLEQRCDLGLRLLVPGRVVEHVRNALVMLILPQLDLVRVQVELCRQLAHRPVTVQGCLRDLRLEDRALAPFRPSCHLRTFVPARLPGQEREIVLAGMFRFPQPPQTDGNVLAALDVATSDGGAPPPARSGATRQERVLGGPRSFG